MFQSFKLSLQYINGSQLLMLVLNQLEFTYKLIYIPLQGGSNSFFTQNKLVKEIYGVRF